MEIDLFLSEGPGLIPVEFGDWMAAQVRQSEINSRLRTTSLSPESSAFMDLARAGTEAKREAVRLEAIAREAFSRKLAEQGAEKR
ncbi:hypothetical protein [Acidovorax sp.]|uniref:hypothetical protein n=1 Tax=Acidovorax sp. TaxID=1872122 RepID=UPI00391F490A